MKNNHHVSLISFNMKIVLYSLGSHVHVSIISFNMKIGTQPTKTKTVIVMIKQAPANYQQHGLLGCLQQIKNQIKKVKVEFKKFQEIQETIYKTKLTVTKLNNNRHTEYQEISTDHQQPLPIHMRNHESPNRLLTGDKHCT